MTRSDTSPIALLVMVVFASCVPGIAPLHAAQVPLSAFTPAAQVESFEGINTSVVQLLFGPLTLPSGAILLTDEGSSAIEDGQFGTTGAFGSSPVVPVPDGTAFVTQNTLPGTSIHIALPADELRVGAFVAFTSNDVGTITLSAYDATNTLLETISVPSVNLPNWPDNFVGIQNPNGIRYIEFSSTTSVGMVLDGLRFEAVPEPSGLTLAIMSLAAFVAVGRRVRSRRKDVA